MKKVISFISLSFLVTSTFALNCKFEQSYNEDGTYNYRELSKVEKVSEAGELVKGCSLNLVYENSNSPLTKILHLRTISESECSYYTNLSTKLVCFK